MIQIPIALLLLLWHGPSNFERLMQLGVFSQPGQAAAYRAQLPQPGSPAAQAIIASRVPNAVAPISAEETTPTPFPPLVALDLPSPALRSQRNRDGPSAA